MLKSLLEVLIVVACGSAFAADTGARKEAKLDTGKGGIHLVVSVPDFAQGPYDYAMNKGAIVRSHPGLVYGEVMYNAPIDDTVVLVYQADVARRVSVHKGDQMPTAEFLANSLLKDAGFGGRGEKIACPKPPIDDAAIACYKASGIVKFGNRPAVGAKGATVVTAISFNQDRQGYTMMASIYEKDAKAFDADPTKYEKIANKGLGGMFKNHTVSGGDDEEMKREIADSPGWTSSQLAATAIVVKAEISQDLVSEVKWAKRLEVGR